VIKRFSGFNTQLVYFASVIVWYNVLVFLL